MSDDRSNAKPPLTLWEQQVVGDKWTFYAGRFDKLFAAGGDVEGEARFVDAMLPREASVLDAGCGTGRIASALHRMGHRAVGVDKDAGLVAIARGRYPGVPYLVSDLFELNAGLLEKAQLPTQFDVIALPGNVMVYMAPGTQGQIMGNLAGLLKPAGRIVAGFATDRAYGPGDFRDDARANGLTVELEFSTWQMDPMDDSSGWAVIVLRAPGSGGEPKATNWAPAAAWAQDAGASPASP